MGSSQSKVVESEPNPASKFDRRYSIGMTPGLRNHLAGSDQENNNVGTTSGEEEQSYRRIPEQPSAASLQQAYDQGVADMKSNLDAEVQTRVEEEFARREQLEKYGYQSTEATFQREATERDLRESMKHEDRRVKTVKQYADALAKRQPNTPERSLQCNLERSKCLACYTDALENKRLTTECAEFVDAFAKVGTQADRFGRRGHWYDR